MTTEEQTLTCPNCSNTENIVGIEYDHRHPEYYDGVSEWWCPACRVRWGRWTNNILKEGQQEPRYGGTSHP